MKVGKRDEKTYGRNLTVLHAEKWNVKKEEKTEESMKVWSNNSKKIVYNKAITAQKEIVIIPNIKRSYKKPAACHFLHLINFFFCLALTTFQPRKFGSLTQRRHVYKAI